MLLLQREMVMGSNFYFEPSDPAFKAHKGYLPKEGLIHSLGAYDKYVKGEGRKVDLPTWLGTAIQEGTLSKNEVRSNSDLRATHSNPMWANPLLDEKYVDTVAKQRGIITSIPIGKEDVIARHDRKMSNIARIMDYMQDRGINPFHDYAAYKLDEGMRRFGTPEKASRWYNWYDTVPREKLPQLGRDLLANPTVKEIMKSITEFYSGQQYRDKLKKADKPLEGGFF